MSQSIAEYFRAAARAGDGTRHPGYIEFDLTPGEVAQWPSLAYKMRVRVHPNGRVTVGPFTGRARRRKRR
jgi:hypothetical protein